jgi:hypothetical protein
MYNVRLFRIGTMNPLCTMNVCNKNEKSTQINNSKLKEELLQFIPQK